MNINEILFTHGTQKMNRTDFGNPPTFDPAPPADLSFHLSSKISNNNY